MTINVELRDEQAARLDRFATGLRKSRVEATATVDRRRIAPREAGSVVRVFLKNAPVPDLNMHRAAEPRKSADGSMVHSAGSAGNDDGPPPARWKGAIPGERRGSGINLLAKHNQVG
jgi:hypothetical protein